MIILCPYSLYKFWTAYSIIWAIDVNLARRRIAPHVARPFGERCTQYKNQAGETTAGQVSRHEFGDTIHMRLPTRHWTRSTEGMKQIPDITTINRLRIINFPDPVLRQPAQPVTDFDDRLAALASRMCELMHSMNGVGLAGPQVGLPLRVFVWNPTGDPEGDRMFVNPVLSDLSDVVESEEGCLSIPNVNVTVRRAKSIRVSAQDVAGNDVCFEGEDLVARIWQHETDHLDGKLILDYMSPADEIANRRAIKDLEAQYKRANSRR